MPVKLHVENFQSLENAHLVIDGLTVVTGSNNSGKTSQMRAIYGCFTNAPSTSFLRHGTDKLTVSMEFSGTEKYQADTIVWEKGTKTKPTYTVNGKQINPGRETPKEVLALGVQPVTAGSVTLWPQIAPQFSGTVFLLDLSGSAIAEAVADVDRVGKLTGALKFAESDKRSATSELKVRRKDVGTAQEAVNGYHGLDDVQTQHTELVSLWSDIQTVLSDQEWQVQTRGNLKQAMCQVAVLTGIRLVLLPDSLLVSECVSKLIWAQEYQHKLDQANLRVYNYAGVADISVPVLPEKITALIQMLGQLRELRTRYQSTQRQVQTARDMAGVCVLPDVLASKLFDVLTEVRGLRTKLSQAKLDVGQLDRLVYDTDTAYKQACVEVQSLFTENGGECPTCGGMAGHSH